MRLRSNPPTCVYLDPTHRDMRDLVREDARVFRYGIWRLRDGSLHTAWANGHTATHNDIHLHVVDHMPQWHQDDPLPRMGILLPSVEFDWEWKEPWGEMEWEEGKERFAPEFQLALELLVTEYVLRGSTRHRA